MADSGSFLLHEQFVCSICLELFSRPVTLPCGHNFCCGCVTQAWDVSGKSCCPLCKENFTMRPELRVNTMLCQTSAALKERNLRKETAANRAQKTAANQTEERGSGRRDTERAALVSAAQGKMRRLEENLSALRDEAMVETDTSVRLFAAFARTAESVLSELLEDIERRQRAAEQRVHHALEQVREEMAVLSRTKADLEDLGRTEDPLDFLKRFRGLDQDHREEEEEEEVQGSLEGVVRSAVETLRSELSSELQKLSKAELRSVQKFAVDVSLDSDTAHAALLLSDDRKGVHCGDAKRDLPYSAARFTDSPCVLSKPLRQRAAKIYYEVQVGGKTRWYLGVAKASVPRQGQVAANPASGLWVIWLKGGGEYRALDEPAVALELRRRSLDRVGVFVDRGEGLVRFYDADSAERIYTFTGCSFAGDELRAFFGPCSGDGGRNTAPLVIMALKKRRSVT